MQFEKEKKNFEEETFFEKETYFFLGMEGKFS